MDRWQRKRILILGMTYPSYSAKYTENVCTGGLEEGSLKMVRLHPVPHRYLEPANRFHAFQWITADVTPHQTDPRPESMRLKPDSVEPGETIPARNEARRDLLEASPHLMRSVEELEDRQKRDGTSLGIVVPKAITGYDVELRDPKERQEWIQKEQAVLAQKDLFDYELKPIDFPQARFFVSWECDDIRCKGHRMSLLQWGIHELHRKLRDDADCSEKVLQRMKAELEQKDCDVFLFLGNFRDRQYRFGLMDSYSAPRILQQRLL